MCNQLTTSTTGRHGHLHQSNPANFVGPADGARGVAVMTPSAEPGSDDPVLIRLLNDGDDANIAYDSAKVHLWLAADRKLMTERSLKRYHLTGRSISARRGSRGDR